MSCKSLLYTALPSTATVAAGGVVPLGNVVRRYGCAIRMDGDSITLLEPGYYAISVTATVQPTATTAFNLVVLENGIPLQGAITTVAPTDAGNSTPMMIPRTVSRVYCNGTKNISVQLSAAGTVTHFAVVVEKV